MSPGKLGLVWMILISTVVVEITAYSIKYFDCSDISSIKTYKTNQMCKVGNKTDTTTHQFTILQDQDIQETTGFSCRVLRSTITEYCGSFSHNKLAKAPEIEVHHPLTIEQCHHMVNTQSFTTKEGKASIKIGVENLITSYDLGVIQVNADSISCKGQPAKFGSSIVNDILQVSQYKIVIQKEKFLIDHQRNQVEAAADHLMLPCRPENRGCAVADRTFVWQLSESRCPLEKIRTVSMKEDNGYQIDETHKILLRKGTPVPSPRGCPTSTLYNTEYPNIYLSESRDWPNLSGAELDMAEFVKARDNYLGFRLEEKITQEDGLLQSQVCKNSVKANNDELISLPEEGMFMKRNGDTYSVFKCKAKVGTLKSAETCHEDIPIEGGFVKPNRVLTSHSAPKPCNKHFGLKVLTLENSWVEINPHIKATAEPEDLPNQLNLNDFEHEDLSDGGLYTTAELDAWKRHIELSDYHMAISKSISYGVCTARGDCEANAGMPAYDLTNLYPDSIMDQYNPWNKADKWIQKWGTWISLMVILVETFHFVVWIVAIIYTMTYDGIIGLQAFLFLMCCKPMGTSSTVNRRHQRLNNRVEKKQAKKAKSESVSYEEMEMGATEGSYAVNGPCEQ